MSQFLHVLLFLSLLSLTHGETGEPSAPDNLDPHSHGEGGGFLSFLDTIDGNRRAMKHHYSYLLDSLANYSRVDVPIGTHKRTTSVLSKEPHQSRVDRQWTALGDASSSYLNPAYYLWFVAHLFHTTTVTVSCNAGGEHGDVDLDAFEGCDLTALRLDVNRDDNALCQTWETTDLTQPAQWTTDLYTKAAFAYRHNRFPTKSDLGRENANKNTNDDYVLTPGQSLSNLVKSTTPPWLVRLTGVDHQIEHVFGFCKPCSNNNGGGGCGSSLPEACTRHDESYGDWILRNVVGASTTTSDTHGMDEDDSDTTDTHSDTTTTTQLPPLCHNPSTTAQSRTVLHPYTCTESSCKFVVSPYQNPSVRVVDVHNQPTTKPPSEA